MSNFVKPGGLNRKIKIFDLSIEKCFDQSYDFFLNRIFYCYFKVDFKVYDIFNSSL